MTTRQLVALAILLIGLGLMGITEAYSHSKMAEWALRQKETDG